MSGYTLNQKEMDRLIAYLNDEDPDVIHTDIPKRYLHVAYDLQKKMLSDLSSVWKGNTSLKKQIDRLKGSKTEAYAGGNFAEHEGGFHDTDIALIAIRHFRGMNARYSLEKVIHVVYLAYAVFLQQGVRLTIEHPQAWEKGPWFWRVSSRMKDGLYAEPDPDAVRDINRRDPAVSAIVKNICAKYRDVDTRDMLVRSKPFKENDKEHNGGKWNREIPDSEIWAWQKSRSVSG